MSDPVTGPPLADAHYVLRSNGVIYRLAEQCANRDVYRFERADGSCLSIWRTAKQWYTDGGGLEIAVKP